MNLLLWGALLYRLGSQLSYTPIFGSLFGQLLYYSIPAEFVNSFFSFFQRPFFRGFPLSWLDKGFHMCYPIYNNPDSKLSGCLKGANMVFCRGNFRGLLLLPYRQGAAIFVGRCFMWKRDSR